MDPESAGGVARSRTGARQADRIPAALRASALLAAALLAAAGAGCADDAIVLDIEADQPAQVLRIEIKAAPEAAAWTELIEVDPAGRNRDISDPAQAFRLAIRLPGPGRYGVHVVALNGAGVPVQSWASFFSVDGTLRRRAHLYTLGVGVDDDADGWPETCPGSARPGDCSPEVLDCDDAAGDTHPFGVEVCREDGDEDCDARDECFDADGDGWYHDEDCDDRDPDVHPRAEPGYESASPCDGLCDNGKDEDCVGGDEPCHVDGDCDGHFPDVAVGDPAYDCDDADAATHAGAPELCDDQIDQNCTGFPDEGCEQCDKDGDGYRDGAIDACAGAEPADCDDTDRLVNPGSTADCGGSEGTYPCTRRGMCANDRDDDCDGEVNDGCPADPGSCDKDGDGYAAVECDPPAALADCDDDDPTVYPGAPERCGDGIAQNCSLDLPCTSDADGDGYNAGVDCDDANPHVNPSVVEVCDGVDQDCDLVIDEGNPGVTPDAGLGGARCNLDNDGACQPDDVLRGLCVCSSEPQPLPLDEAGDRAACPGESPGAPWAPRCFGAHAATIERCNAVDDDCDGTPDETFALGLACDTDDADLCERGTTVCTDDGLATECLELEVDLRDVCNGEDDDCDETTPDGAHDPLVAVACDGSDTDLCLEGQTYCAGGVVLCGDVTASTVELCDDVASPQDEDCDGQKNEGFHLREACDGTDADLCADGLWICGSTTTAACTDDATSRAELCNGLDDDCNPATADGAHDTRLGIACDGADSDACKEGVTVCSAGGNVTCNDATGDSLDLCNGDTNDDCDTGTADGSGDSRVGVQCDGADGDSCKEGTSSCSDGAVACSDSTGTTTETCNNIDDDCDGTTDEGATCSNPNHSCIGGECRMP